MTVSGTLTYDAAIPFRPLLTDVVGGTKENDPKFAPNPVTMPTAEEDNQKSGQIAAFARVIGLCKLSVTFPGGTPTITNVKCLGTTVDASDFTLVDNGAGDTTIWWATASVLPTVSGMPEVSQGDDTEIDRLRAFYTTVSGNPAVRIKSKLSTSGTDAAFIVTIN